MAEVTGKLCAAQIKLMMETQQNFPQRFKQHLVSELQKMENHFEFIGTMLSKGVLCDGSDDSEGNFTIKEMMVHLAVTIACSKGADAIGDLMESLEGSGNLELFAAAQTWVKINSGSEDDGNLSQPKKVDASVVQNAKLEISAKNPYELSSSATMLIDKIMSHEQMGVISQLEVHLMGKSSELNNVPEFCSSLVGLNVLDESDMQLKSGQELQSRQWTEKAIKAACSKRAIGSLVVSLQRSGNGRFIDQTLEWLESSQVRKKNYPIAVKSLAEERLNQEQTTPLGSGLSEQSAPPNDLQKVATFNCQSESSTNGPLAVEFDKDRMIAYLADGTLKMWNWHKNDDMTIRFRVNAKDITWFQYDEEIIIVGTARGTVHLFDVKTQEEKWSIRLDGPVRSLQFVECTLGIVVQGAHGDQLWWVDISRSDMRLHNQRLTNRYCSKAENSGIFMTSERSFLYSSDFVTVHCTKSGHSYWDHDHGLQLNIRCLKAPADIITLNVVDLISTERYVVAGCKNGMIALWRTGTSIEKKTPTRSFQGHMEAVVSLCAVSGHLLSLDHSGKLFMWSGYDLENSQVRRPVPRVLAENFSNVTSLVAHERWFASSSSEDGIVNIWTLPDLWLRTG